MAVHQCFEPCYISLPSSAKQRREMTKFYLFCSTRNAKANFWYLLSELNADVSKSGALIAQKKFFWPINEEV